MKKTLYPQFTPVLSKIPNKKASVSALLEKDLFAGSTNSSVILSTLHRQNQYTYISSYENAILTKNQIESCKKILNRSLKKYKIKSIVLIQYTIIETKKSIGSRMGKGKGKVTGKVALVKKNEKIFQFKKLSSEVLKGLVLKIRHKLPMSVFSE